MSFDDFPCSGHLTFNDWTSARKITSVGSNAGASVLPFQNWRRFKEAFAPELIERAARETPGPLHRIVDPFGGSGTTALAAQFLGLCPTTIEVNPYLADLIEAKIAPVDLDAAAEAFEGVVNDVHSRPLASRPIFRGAPKTFVEPGSDGRFIFSRAVAARILNYRHAIDEIESLAIRRLFRVILASATIPASNVVVSGKGRRYRRDWQSRSVSVDFVDLHFRRGALQALHDLRRFSDRRVTNYTLLRGDARELISSIGGQDLAVFSPPYPNSFDYTDVYNVELWALGYLDSAEKSRRLRQNTIRSHVQIKRSMDMDGVKSRTLSEVIERLSAVRSSLWSYHIPEMIGAYASDMLCILKGMSSKMRTRSRAYMVVGDSRYAGIHVPVAQILAEVSIEAGFEVLQVEPCRSMRVSPQQGGRPELPESLLILHKR